MDPIQFIRDMWGQYHCSFSWYRRSGIRPWGLRFDQYLFTFSHSCGDGCCSWSEDYVLDVEDTPPELVEFFAQNPKGEEYYNESSEEES